MGQSSTNGGYTKLDAISPEQMNLLKQVLQSAQPQIQGAEEGYRQFLPGGGGGKPIIDAAMNRYKQQTIPSILNAFGSNAKDSSSLNQALAASAADLNTNLGSQLAQMQLEASRGLGGLGLGQQQTGLNTQSFAYQPNQQPFWQSAILAGTGALGQAAGGWLSKPTPWKPS